MIDLIAIGGVSYLALLWAQNAHYRRDPGASSWGKKRDAKRAKLLSDRGPVFGRFGRKLLRDDSDSHWLVFGASGTGKSTTIFVTSLFECNDRSIIVNDPKGELYEQTSAHRAQLGNVYRIDLADPNGDKFNALDLVRWGELEEYDDCQRLVESLPAPVDAKDDHWEDTARRVLTAAMRHYRPANMGELYHHAHAMEGDLDALEKVPGELGMYAVMADKERSGVRSTLLRLLAPWASMVVRRVTESSSFDAADLACESRPATIYITVPDSDSRRLSPVSGFILQALVSVHIEKRKTIRGRKKLWPVLALIDEFPQLGKLRFMVNAAAVLRGYGWKILFACQGRSQLESTYGTARIFQEICACVWETATNDERSLSAASALVGDRLELRGVRQLDGKISLNETRQPGLSTGDFHSLPDKFAVVHRVGHPAIRARKLHPWKWWRHPIWWLKRGEVSWR